MSEFQLLSHIFAANARLASSVLIPPGDDMAMLRLSGPHVLAAVDQLIDGRHFHLASTPIHLIARKAVARSVSDIAAMAARPLASLAAAILPLSFPAENASALFDAIRNAAESFDCPLVGGDIAFHSSPAHPLTLSVTVLAEPVDFATNKNTTAEQSSADHASSGGGCGSRDCSGSGRGHGLRNPGKPQGGERGEGEEGGKGGVVTRSGAQPGDLLCVSGALGGSLESSGLGHHLTFQPRVDLALALSQALGPRLHAMIDISDGLGRDASHIAQCSNVALHIDSHAVPCNPGISLHRALSDGEDYELLFAAAPPIPQSLLAVPISIIGRVLPPNPASTHRVFLIHNSTATPIDSLGWEHRSPI